MNKDFELFKKEFTKYQKLFGLTGYKVYFKYEPVGDRFAGIIVKQGVQVAVARLNSQLDDGDKPFRNIKKDAKHEAIHLLIHRLADNGKYRFSTEAEIDEACEELVVKLEDLIP